MELPRAIVSAIETLRADRKAGELSAAYERLSERYRRESATNNFFLQDDLEALAYAASRLPATYAAVDKVLENLAALDPDFSPKTLCDAGAGPGTAALACFGRWSETLCEARLLEPNVPLRSLGQRLMAELGYSARYDDARLQAMNADQPCDLVMASYVLNELPESDVPDVLERLWNVSGDILVLVETGTPFGYKTLMRAREYFRARTDAYIWAPCPHDALCPMMAENGGNWCHFSVRVQRSSLHKMVKPAASLGYEDEKFAYLILSRRPVKRPASRVVGAPKGQKVLSLPLCRADGRFEVLEASKRHPDFSTLRRLDWGDAWTDTQSE